MSRFVRASKFRHVYGTPNKKEQCYDNIKPSRNAWDSNLIKANPYFLGVCWEAAGGGAFAVINQQKDMGKLKSDFPVFHGHKAVVLDIDFHPFNDYVVASCSEDTKVMVWNIPETMTEKITEPLVTLSGHARKVGHVIFHPTADNTLASCSGDLAVKLWDIEKGQQKTELIGCTDLIQSLTFNYNGSLCATSCRDKKLRVFDIRANKVVQEADSHTGVKNSRAVWLGDTNRIATTGFAKTSERQMYIWDISNGITPVVQETLDTSAGVLIPHYDADCKMLYLSGKGDGNIRYYEMVDEKPWQFLLSEYKSGTPQKGVGFLPKRAVNVSEIEVAKAFKLTTTQIEPISFKVPRKTDVFQADIFPDASSGDAAMSCDEFFSGKDSNPKLVNLEGGFQEGVRKILNVTAAAPPGQKEEKDLNNPKNEKELREAWHKLQQENKDLKDKLAQKDVQIRQLELKLQNN